MTWPSWWHIPWTLELQTSPKLVQHMRFKIVCFFPRNALWSIYKYLLHPWNGLKKKHWGVFGHSTSLTCTADMIQRMVPQLASKPGASNTCELTPLASSACHSLQKHPKSWGHCRDQVRVRQVVEWECLWSASWAEMTSKNFLSESTQIARTLTRQYLE